EPKQVGFGGPLVVGRAARAVGVVEPQDERAAMPLGEQPVEQRRAHVADMQKPGGARRETDDGCDGCGIGHAGRLVAMGRWRVKPPPLLSPPRMGYGGGMRTQGI